MPIINKASREIMCKLVYYGPEGSGKYTTLMSLFMALYPQATSKDRYKVFVEGYPDPHDPTRRITGFDYMPLAAGSIQGFQPRVHISAIHDPILYASERIGQLKGADGIVFVVDSRAEKLQENLESKLEIDQYLSGQPSPPPVVIQWNKRDLLDVLPISVLEKYLNPMRVPAFETVAITGQGMLECLKASLKALLQKVST